MSRATASRSHSREVQDYRLSELEREQDQLARQLYRMALRHEDVRQELKEARQETKQGFGDLGDLLHNRFAWLLLALLTSLFILGILVVDFRFDLAQWLGA